MTVVKLLTVVADVLGNDCAVMDSPVIFKTIAHWANDDTNISLNSERFSFFLQTSPIFEHSVLNF